MYILAIAIHFWYFLGFLKPYEQYHAQKVQKKAFMLFFSDFCTVTEPKTLQTSCYAYQLVCFT